MEAGDLVALMGVFAQAMSGPSKGGAEGGQKKKKKKKKKKKRKRRKATKKKNGKNGKNGEEEDDSDSDSDSNSDSDDDDDDEDMDTVGPSAMNAYLYDPRIFNARYVRNSCIPGCNALVSATGLARFFAALGHGGKPGETHRKFTCDGTDYLFKCVCVCVCACACVCVTCSPTH